MKAKLNLLLIFLFILSSGFCISQNVKILYDGYNYTVFLKDKKGNCTDTSKFGAVRPILKNGYMYTFTINPNTKFFSGYVFWISKYDISGTKFKLTKEYSFSIISDKKRNDCRIEQSLANSIQVKATSKRIVFSFYANGKNKKIKIPFNETNLLTLNLIICREITKYYSPNESCFVCD